MLKRKTKAPWKSVKRATQCESYLPPRNMRLASATLAVLIEKVYPQVLSLSALDERCYYMHMNTASLRAGENAA